MILTIGDSFTYGAELENRLERAWPYLLDDKSVTNLGKGGGSNDRIFRLAIEETCKQKYDIVIIGWSFPNRLEVFHEGEPWCVNIHNRYRLDWVEHYFKYSYDENFGFRQWFSHVLALQEYFKSIGQRYIFCNVAGMLWRYKEYKKDLDFLLDKIDPTYYPGWPNEGMVEWQGDCPRGPGGHPLELGHQRIADRINEHIRNLGWFPRRSGDSN